MHTEDQAMRGVSTPNLSLHTSHASPRPPQETTSHTTPHTAPNHVLTLSLRTVHASIPSNTFALYGAGEDKELTELVPGILNQLGPDSLASLRKLAESYQSMQKEKGGKEGEADDDDDDIPDLVAGQDFEGGKGEVE